MRAHYLAVKARLEADTALSGKVHDSALVTAAGLPQSGTYALLYGGSPDSYTDHRLAALQTASADAVYAYTVRSVSTTADGVRSVQSKVAAQLMGHVLIVPGRSCRVEWDDSTEPDWDRTVTPPLYFADQTFLVHSSRV